MTTYVVVAVVRIGEWLARTPRLSLLRGASGALTSTTTWTAIKGLGLNPCTQAGEVAGVVAVELPEGADAVETADLIARHLRDALPAVELDAWWQAADSYSEAYLAHVTDDLNGVRSAGHKRYLPALLDVPLAETCYGCRQESAVGRRDFPGEPGRPLGPDCLVRYKTGYPSSGNSDADDDPADDRGRPGGSAATFRELARLGGVSATAGDQSRRADVRNHLATVYADGNGLGGFMTKLADLSGSHAAVRLREGIVAIINDAARGAYDQAAEDARVDDPLRQPAIKHLIGGDDILLSVAAPLAWDFVISLMTAFQDLVVANVEDLVGTAEEITTLAARLSLGVGITFAHESHPFDDARALAFDAMKAGKKAVRGAEGVVSWVDLTAENHLPARRHVRLSQLKADHGTGMPLARLSPSARAVLSGMFRDCDPDAFPPMGSPDTSYAAAERRRLGHGIVAWAKRTNAAPVLQMLESDPASLEKLADLRDGLSRLRWWPDRDGSSTGDVREDER